MRNPGPPPSAGAARSAAASVLGAVLLASCVVALPAGCGRVEKERPLDEVIAAAKAGDRRAVRDLLGRFAHPDSAVTEKAWEAVVALGPAAERELIAALDDGNPAVAESAAGALGTIKSRAAVGSLAKALRTWEKRRYVAAWALGEIGDPLGIPPLVAAMGDRDGEVRKYATRSLVKFGREAVPALLAALGDRSADVRRYAARALGEIRDERSVGPLLALEGKVDPEVRLWALGRLGDRLAFPAIAAAARDPDARTRLAAVQALHDLGDERAVPILKQSLEDPEWTVREWSARALESITGGRHRYRNQHGEDVYPYAIYR